MATIIDSAVSEVEDNIPVYSTLDEVYLTETDNAKRRYETIGEEFQRLYGEEPALFARAPGRVNLIGEHIDYEGYSVLPMAIRQDTVVAIRVVVPTSAGGDTSVLRVASTSPDKYPPQEFRADPTQEVDTGNHSWALYFLCGYKGVYEQMAAAGLEPAADRCGLEVLIDGQVPTGAGLSSSAALVCASAIAIMAAFGLNFPKSEVAEFCCKCERHIGTQSGGMDQAIAIMARPGVAKLIDFHPLKATDVVLPQGGTLVIANSLAVSNKAETAAAHYNYRVVECRLAAMVLAVKLGMEKRKAREDVTTLGDVEGLCVQAADAALDGPLSTVAAKLHEEAYTREEVEEIVGVKLADLFAASAPSLGVLSVATTFKLNQRARHVYAEARRVHAFRQVASLSEAAQGSGAEDDVLDKLGNLMNDSHLSCSQLYDCSCPELEELVQVCRRNGALGARLTGAGWGGCTVSLVPDARAPAFIEALKEEFYKARVEAGAIKKEDLDVYVFASKPAGGAAIFKN